MKPYTRIEKAVDGFFLVELLPLLLLFHSSKIDHNKKESADFMISAFAVNSGFTITDD